MSDFENYPKQSYFDTELTAGMGAADTTITLNDVPDYTFGTETQWFTVSPNNSTKVEIRPFTGISGSTLTGVGVAQPLYVGGSATSQAHSAGEQVILGDVHQYWDAVRTAVNSKADSAGDTFTGAIGFSGTTHQGISPIKLTTTQRNALSLTGSDTAIVYDTDIGEYYAWQGGAWSALASGSTQANASETVAGKSEEGTQTETDTGEQTGTTGAKVFSTPYKIGRAIQKGSWDYAADSGAADAYVTTHAPVPAAYATGMRLFFKPSATNTGASTIDVNSLGAKDIKKHGAVALVAGDIVQDTFALIEYDGTQFQLLNPQAVVNQLSAIGATVTPTNLGTNTDKSVDAITHLHEIRTREVRQLARGGGFDGFYGSATIPGVVWTDAALSEITFTLNPFIRPTGCNISSMKLHIGNVSGGAVSGDLYLRFFGHSVEDDADSAITADTVGYAAYAFSTAADNSISSIDVPAAAYASWDAGERLTLAMQRDATHASDTLNATVYGAYVEVIYTIA